jgi:hypothetical protein
MEVRSRVTAYGLIAASNMPAFPAEPQVDPALIDFQALFTSKRLRNNIPDRRHVPALFHRTISQVSQHEIFRPRTSTPETSTLSAGRSMQSGTEFGF